MYNYFIIILLVFLVDMLTYRESFTSELSVPVVSLFVLLALMSISISKEIREMEKELSKAKRHNAPKKIKLVKKNSTDDKSKYYFASFGGNVVRGYICKNGKFIHYGPLYKISDLNKDTNIVTSFKSINEVKENCIISLTRKDGVVFSTTDTQFIFPNGFIITLTKLTDSVYTGIDISDLNEDVPYKLLKRFGSDDSGRFYVKHNSELLLILKIIFNIKGRMYYENES